MNKPNLMQELDTAVNLVRLHFPTKTRGFLRNVRVRKRFLGLAQNPVRFGGKAQIHVVEVSRGHNTFGRVGHSLGFLGIALAEPLNARLAVWGEFVAIAAHLETGLIGKTIGGRIFSKLPLQLEGRELAVNESRIRPVKMGVEVEVEAFLQ